MFVQVASIPNWIAVTRFSSDAVLWTVLVAAPLPYMLFSDRTFERGEWTSQIFATLVFCTGVLLGVDRRRHGIVACGALVTAVISSSLNVYELFVKSNVWSTAPGRSAGWYVNPNLSAADICLYGSIYILLRRRSAAWLDLPVLVLIFIGVLSTFSRSGFALMLLPALAFFVPARGEAIRLGRLIRAAAGIAIIALPASFAIAYIASNVDLTTDASSRLAWLLGKGERDLSIEGREDSAAEALNLFLNSPVTGEGVRVTAEMIADQPHNMFLSIAIDMGVFPLLAYMALIVRAFVLGGNLTANAQREGYLLLSVAAWLLIYSFASHNIMTTSSDLLAIGLSISAAEQFRAREKQVAQVPAWVRGNSFYARRFQNSRKGLVVRRLP